MTGQETRNKLTDYWRSHDINEGREFAILTNIIHQEWSGVSVNEHKGMRGLKSQNLRDHMPLKHYKGVVRPSAMTNAD